MALGSTVGHGLFDAVANGPDELSRNGATDDSAAIKLDSTQPVYFDNRGLSYAASGDDDRAIADFDEAIRLSPTAGSLTNRGDAYQHKGDHDRAIVDYDRALKLDPA